MRKENDKTKWLFVQRIIKELDRKIKHNRKSVEKIAASLRITESLQGRDAHVQQTELKERYERHVANAQEKEIHENAEHYELLTKQIPNEKKLKKILEKQGNAAYQEAIKEREKELPNARKLSDRKNWQDIR